MLDLRLFAIPTFTGASVVVMVLAASTFGPFLYLTLFLLDAAGASPTAVGLQLLPLSAAALVVSVLAAASPGSCRVRAALPAGQLLCAAGLLAMRGLEATSPWTVMLPGCWSWGSGSACANPAVTYAALGRRAGHPQRHGLGGQQHLPPGRHRHRHRRPGHPAPGPVEGDPAAFAAAL
jgi:predicted MFS family arabinose efflux permease